MRPGRRPARGLRLRLGAAGRAALRSIGLRAIRGLRDRAEQSLGGRFDPKAYHTALLEQGALPLDLLESRLNRWLASQH